MLTIIDVVAILVPVLYMLANIKAFKPGAIPKVSTTARIEFLSRSAILEKYSPKYGFANRAITVIHIIGKKSERSL